MKHGSIIFSSNSRCMLHIIAGLAWLAIAVGLRDDAWNGAFSTSGVLSEPLDVSTTMLKYKGARSEVLNMLTMILSI